MSNNFNDNQIKEDYELNEIPKEYYKLSLINKSKKEKIDYILYKDQEIFNFIKKSKKNNIKLNDDCSSVEKDLIDYKYKTYNILLKSISLIFN